MEEWIKTLKKLRPEFWDRCVELAGDYNIQRNDRLKFVKLCTNFKDERGEYPSLEDVSSYLGILPLKNPKDAKVTPKIVSDIADMVQGKDVLTQIKSEIQRPATVKKVIEEACTNFSDLKTGEAREQYKTNCEKLLRSIVYDSEAWLKDLVEGKAYFLSKAKNFFLKDSYSRYSDKPKCQQVGVAKNMALKLNPQFVEEMLYDITETDSFFDLFYPDLERPMDPELKEKLEAKLTDYIKQKRFERENPGSMTENRFLEKIVDKYFDTKDVYHSDEMEVPIGTNTLHVVMKKPEVENPFKGYF